MCLNFCEILKVLDIKYVIVDLNSDHQVGCMVAESRVTPWMLGNTSYFIKFVEGQQDLEKVFWNENFTIYQNMKFEPNKISTYDSMILLVPPIMDTGAIPTEISSNLLQNPDFEEDVMWAWMDNKYERYTQ